MKTVFIVTGTRPEAIKLAPVILELRRDDGFRVIHCHTNQHHTLAKDVFSFFDTEPDILLDHSPSSGEDLSSLFISLSIKLRDAILHIAPDGILVQGDTQSALAAAICGFQSGIPVFHVEAGLRSHDQFRPFPEEMNRRTIAICSSLHFAPTKTNALQLEKEGIPGDQIYITGNTGIDALEIVKSKLQPTQTDTTGRVLVTMHRRENIDSVIGILADAIKDLVASEGLSFLFTVHPNPAVSEKIRRLLTGIKGVELIEPLPYPAFIGAMNQCQLIITDSGGIQEEAAHLGKRLLICRTETERTEGLKKGEIELLPMAREEMKRRMVEMFRKGSVSVKNDIYGDGRAAERIHEILSLRMGASVH